MKQMKTVLFLALILVVAAGTVFAGGNQAAASSDPNKLSLLYYLDASNPTAVADGVKFLDMFKAQNPSIEVTRENLFSEAYHDKMRVYASAGNLPDVMYVWPSGRSAYLHDEGLLKNLTPFINRDGLRDKYKPYALDPTLQQSGYVAMIPNSMTSTHTFWANTEVLSAAGLQPATTYAELAAQVATLRARGVGTLFAAAGDGWVVQSCLFSMIAGRFCGKDWEQGILAKKTKFTDPDFVAALTFLKQMYDDGVLSRDILGYPYSEQAGQFASGRWAYAFDGDWNVGPYTTDPDTKVALLPIANQRNIRIGVFPTIPGTKFNDSSSTIVGAGYGMRASLESGSAKEENAWKLVKFFAGPEVQAISLEHGAYPSSSRTDINTASIPFEPLSLTMAALQFANSTIVIDGAFSNIDNDVNNALTEIGMGTMTPQQAAQAIQRAFDAAY